MANASRNPARVDLTCQSSPLLLRQIANGVRQLVRLWLVTSRPRVSVQLLRELRESVPSRLTRELLRRGKLGPRRRDLVGCETTIALELVEVRPCQRERRRPHELRLT